MDGSYDFMVRERFAPPVPAVHGNGAMGDPGIRRIMAIQGGSSIQRDLVGGPLETPEAFRNVRWEERNIAIPEKAGA